MTPFASSFEKLQKKIVKTVGASDFLWKNTKQRHSGRAGKGTDPESMLTSERLENGFRMIPDHSGSLPRPRVRNDVNAGRDRKAGPHATNDMPEGS
jgi:hypothetical protein